jgi:hypothetical protein
MKNIFFLAICGLPFFACSLFGVEGGLSVEETMSLALTQSQDLNGVTNEAKTILFKRKLQGNPAVRNELYKIIADQNQKDKWGTATRYFYFVGQGEDVEKLTQVFDKREGLPQPGEIPLFLGIFHALSGMTAREVTGAKDKLNQLCRPKFWQDRKIRLELGKDYFTYDNYLAYLALSSRAGAFEGDYLKIVQEVVSGIPDSKQAKLMEYELRTHLKTQPERMKDPCRILLTNSIPTALTTTKSVEEKNSAKASPLKGQDDIICLIDSALRAYERISEAFVANDWEKSTPWLSKGENPLMSIELVRNEENIKKHVETFKQKCTQDTQDKTSGMIKELKNRSLKLGCAEVETTNRIKYIELSRGSGEYGAITSKTTTIVRIPCLGTEDLVTQNLPTPISPICRSVSKDKELVIMMIKIGDNWFWCPFGW